jgi:hypothetical protein
MMMGLNSEDLIQRIAELRILNNAAYRERNACVALIARMALALGLKAGIRRDNGETVRPEFRNLVYIDLPNGQISWHVADTDMDLFEGLPPYNGEWDGHSVETKYSRMKELKLPQTIVETVDWWTNHFPEQYPI